MAFLAEKLRRSGSRRTVEGFSGRRALVRAAEAVRMFRLDRMLELTVLDEGRSIRPAKKVFFRDRFAPYEVHVYVAAPKG